MIFLLFLIFLTACVAAGSTGVLFKPGQWYSDLQKPTWTPPGWMFSVAWTSLYLLMSWAAARVAVTEGSGFALALWALQIALNTLWTPVFFGLHRMRTGLVIIVALWITVVAMTVGFFLVDAWAGVMLIPYVAWVSVAASLNYSILKLNPEQAAAVPN